jgi:hypothetical protein
MIESNRVSRAVHVTHINDLVLTFASARWCTRLPPSRIRSTRVACWLQLSRTWTVRYSSRSLVVSGDPEPVVSGYSHKSGEGA